MKSDHFHSPEKTAYRQDCVAFLRKHAGNVLLNENGVLRGRWCELAGASGHLTLGGLVREGMLTDAQFIGVDSDPKNVTNNRAERPEATWECNDLFQALKDFGDVSVLNLDGYREANSRLGTHEVRYLLPTIRSSVAQFGAFVLYYNTDLDAASRQRKRLASNALLDHTVAVCNQLSNWFPGRTWDLSDILTEENARKVDDGYVGSLGEHYFVYRGNRHRMANLKLVFR